MVALRIEDKIAELEPRITKLEQDYDRDISAILEILKKLEVKMMGGLDTNEIGLISDVRDLRREMLDNKNQLQTIEKNVGEIKTSVANNKILTDEVIALKVDVVALKLKVDKHEKYKWFVYGGLLTAGWVISHYKDLLEFLK